MNPRNPRVELLRAVLGLCCIAVMIGMSLGKIDAGNGTRLTMAALALGLLAFGACLYGVAQMIWRRLA